MVDAIGLAQLPECRGGFVGRMIFPKTQSANDMMGIIARENAQDIRKGQSGWKLGVDTEL